MNGYKKISLNGQEYIYDLDPNLIFAYTKDQFEYIYTLNQREITEIVTAKHLDHKLELVIQSVVSCRNSRREPILVVIAMDKKQNNTIFCYYIMEKLLVQVTNNHQIKNEISKASITQDPFNVAFRDKVTEEVKSCYGLVIGTLSGSTDLVLISLNESTMEATIMGIQSIDDKKNPSLGYVTSIHILPPDMNDTRMGHSDPQILLGYSLGSILIYRYRAKIYSYKAPRLRAPINLSEFTEFPNQPIKLLSCVRSYNSLAMTVAFSQDKPEDDIKYADSSPYVKLIETHGDLSRKQRTVLFPSDPTAVILEANLLSSELTTIELDNIIQLDIIYQNSFSFELNIWNVSSTDFKWSHSVELDQGTCYSLIHRRSRLRSDDLLAYYKNTPQRLFQGMLQYQKEMTTDTGLEPKRKASLYQGGSASKRGRKPAVTKAITQPDTDKSSSLRDELNESDLNFDTTSAACSTLSEEDQAPENLEDVSMAAEDNIETSSTVSSTEEPPSPYKDSDPAESTKTENDMVIDESENDLAEITTEETTHTIPQEVITEKKLESVTDITTENSANILAQSSIETSNENVVNDHKTDQWTSIEKEDKIEKGSTVQTNVDEPSEFAQKESHDFVNQHIEADESKSTEMDENFKPLQELGTNKDSRSKEGTKTEVEFNKPEGSGPKEEAFLQDHADMPVNVTVEQALETKDPFVVHEDLGTQNFETQEDINPPREQVMQEDINTPEVDDMGKDINIPADDTMQDNIEKETNFQKDIISQETIYSQDETNIQNQFDYQGEFNRQHSISTDKHIDTLEAVDAPEAISATEVINNQNNLNTKDGTISQDVIETENDIHTEDSINLKEDTTKEDNFITQKDVSTEDDIAICNDDTKDDIGTEDGIDKKYEIFTQDNTDINAQSGFDTSKDDHALQDGITLQDDIQSDINTREDLSSLENFVYNGESIESSENNSAQSPSESPKLPSESCDNGSSHFVYQMEEKIDGPTNPNVLMQKTVCVENINTQESLNEYTPEPSVMLEEQLVNLISIIEQANAERDTQSLIENSTATEEQLIQDRTETLNHESFAVTTENNEQVEIIRDDYGTVDGESVIPSENTDVNQENLDKTNEVERTFITNKHSIENDIINMYQDYGGDVSHRNDDVTCNQPEDEDDLKQDTTLVDEGEKDEIDMLQDEGSVCEDTLFSRDTLSDIGPIENSFVLASNVASPDTTNAATEPAQKVDYIPVMQQDLARLSESSNHSSDQNEADPVLEMEQEVQAIEAANQARLALEKEQENQRIEAAHQAKIAFEREQEEKRIEAIKQSKLASEKEFSTLLYETIKIRDIDTFMKMPLIAQDQIDEIGLSCWYTPDARVKLFMLRYLSKHNQGKMIVPLCKRIFDAPNNFTEEERKEYKAIYKKYIKEFPSYNEDTNVFTAEGRMELTHKELNRFKFDAGFTSEAQKQSFQSYVDYYGFGSNLMSFK